MTQSDRKSGIYEIANLQNGKRYIGSAKDFTKRWGVHRCLLRGGKHHSRHLQAAWIKYGEAAFVFRVIAYCEPEFLLDDEQTELDGAKPEYNVLPNARSSLGRQVTAETGARISAALKGKKRDPAAVAASAAKLRGRKLPPERVAHLIGNTHAAGQVKTPEWRAAASAWMTGRPCPKTQEHREKISAALKGITHSPERRAFQAAAQTGVKRGPYRKRTPEEAEAHRAKQSAAQMGKKRGVNNKKASKHYDQDPQDNGNGNGRPYI